ncbi:argininosuccinate lyase [Leadbetterella byssophila]|uniref:argininosuccinate lyase n=1 Tax=Leadbetterella byssophila TaxID=316068 RepID=UPI0039A35727
MKLWQKDGAKPTNQLIESFTVGRDRELDVLLAPFDLLGSMAHSIMLEKVGLLSYEELQSILNECRKIFKEEITTGQFSIEDGIEDVHSQIEFMLTERIGDTGKKIHSGRSRNDQVLVDLKMFFRDKVEQITQQVNQLFITLQARSEEHKEDLLPGYTHLQIAMPSSFGIWFGAYAESLVDDLTALQGVYKMINKNPLGSGAGYGSSFPLDRKLTTELLGFDDLNYNVVYAQMTRGKMEFALAQAIALFAGTLSRLAMDVCLYNSQNFGFLTLPQEMTTGSSIMPHKKNPDVAEILRGKTNRLKGLATEINFVQSNLPSGYHREFQIIKEIILPALDEFSECLKVADFMVKNLQVKKDILQDPKFDLLFSVENVNKLVVEGTPFRDAYRKVGNEIESGNFTPERELAHTLLGSIGQPATEEIKNAMNKVLEGFKFEKTHQAFEKLLDATSFSR